MPYKKKSHTFMYTQQLTYLHDGESVQDVWERIKNEPNVLRAAIIVHDKDVGEDGKPAEPHFHLMVQFKYARSLSGVAKLFDCERPGQITPWDKRPNNGFAYLIHPNGMTSGKHRYDVTEVTANFDYAAFIDKETSKILKECTRSSKQKMNNILDMIAAGVLPVKEAKDKLSGSEYAGYSLKIDRAHALYLERKHEEQKKRMEKEHKAITVYWFYGSGGTGKTHSAVELASKKGLYFMTTSMKDPFEYYQAEPIIILDELRPETMKYAELLALLNPYAGGTSTVSSRYHNKKWHLIR